MVSERCRAGGIARHEYRFTRRDIREYMLPAFLMSQSWLNCDCRVFLFR